MIEDGTIHKERYVSISGVDVSDYVIELSVDEKKRGIRDGEVTFNSDINDILNVKNGQDIDIRIGPVEEGSPGIERRKLHGIITNIKEEAGLISINCSDYLWKATGETILRIYSIEGEPYKENANTNSDFESRGEFNNTVASLDEIRLDPSETSGTYIYTFFLKNQHNFDIIQILNSITFDIEQNPPTTTVNVEYSIDEGNSWHSFTSGESLNLDCSMIKLKFTLTSTTVGVTPKVNSFRILYNNFLGDVYKIFSDMCHTAGLNTSKNNVQFTNYKIPLMVADNIACFEKMSEIAGIFDWDLHFDSVNDMVCLSDSDLYSIYDETLKIGENVTNLPNYTDDLYLTINEVEMQGVTTYPSYQQVFDYSVVGALTELRLIDPVTERSLGPLGDYVQVVRNSIIESPNNYLINKDDATITLNNAIVSGEVVIVNFTIPELINIVVNDKESINENTKRKLVVPVRDVLTEEDALERGLSILEYGRNSFKRISLDSLNIFNLSCRNKVNFIDPFMNKSFFNLNVQSIKWQFPSPQDKISIGDINFNYERFMIKVEERIRALERKYKEGITLTENIYDLQDSYLALEDLEIQEFEMNNVQSTDFLVCMETFSVKGEGADGGNEFDQYAGWRNSDNVKTGTDYASSGLIYGDNIGDIKTQYLKMTNFGFSIPDNAVITGIEVELTRMASHKSEEDYSRCVRDYNLTLTKNGKQVFWSAFTEEDRNQKWETTDQVKYYGGDGHLWGDTWTPAEIRSRLFGVMLSVRVQNGSSGTDVTAQVKFLRVKIYYKTYKNIVEEDCKLALDLETSPLSGNIVRDLSPESNDGELRINATAYYPFNGNANDESVNSNNLTAVTSGAGELNLATDHLGNSNNVYDFVTNSTSHITDFAYFVPTTNITLSANSTISFWHYTRTVASEYTGGNAYLNGRSGFFGLSTDDHDSCIGWEKSDGTMMIQDQTGTTLVPSVGLLLNTWQHITITIDASRVVRVYVNGVGTGVSGTLVDDIVFDRIGIGYGNLNHDGLLDDILVLQTTRLSDDEVLNLYNVTSVHKLDKPLVTKTDSDGNTITGYELVKAIHSINPNKAIIPNATEMSLYFETMPIDTHPNSRTDIFIDAPWCGINNSATGGQINFYHQASLNYYGSIQSVKWNKLNKILITYSATSGELRFYMDNILTRTVTGLSGATTSSSNIAIGWRNTSDGQDGLNHTFSKPLIFDRVLTEQERDKIFEGTLKIDNDPKTRIKRVYKWTNFNDLDNGTKDANIKITDGVIEFD
jgi:hypothetical protein